MSTTIWCLNKYAALPSARKGSARTFLLLREMVRQGHRCVLITSDSNHLTDSPEFAGPRLRRTVDGVDVHWLRTFKYRGAKSRGRVLSWLDFEWQVWRMPKRELPRPDVVIASSLSLLSILNGLWLKWKYGCRLVFEVRDIWPLTIVEEGGYSPRNPLVQGLAALERLAYRRADAIVGTMPNLGAHVDRVVRTHGPVHCIPLGLDEEMLAEPAPLPADWVDRHVPAGKFIVCHGGTIGITNALEPLLACARSLRDRPDIHFLMVGEGDLRARYEAECADLQNITFTGPVPKNQVQSVLRLCDVLYFSTHPSRVWAYGLSLNKVMDYLLAGKPVTASYSGYPTMIDEAGAGTSVPSGDVLALRDEIVRLADLPPEALADMGRRGRDWLLRNRQYSDLASAYLDILTPARADA